MNPLKRWVKRHSHNALSGALAGLGRSLNRFYENRNHDPLSNGEAEMLRRLAALGPRVIIDAGANVGHYSKLALACCPSATVYALEPVSATFARLQQAAPQAGPRFQPRQIGLAAQPGEANMHIYPAHTHASLFDIQGIRDQPLATERIALSSLDRFFEEENIPFADLVKLDLEGAEWEALQGMSQSLAAQRIRALQFEYGYINISTRRLLLDFYEFLRPQGYLIGKIYPRRVVFRDYSWKHEDFIGPNFLAIRAGDEALRAALERKPYL